MKLSDRDRRLICLWLAGWKTECIADELGMSHARMRFRAMEIGLPRRKIRGLNLWPSIVAWAKDGHDAMEIAKGLECTKPELVAGCGNFVFHGKQKSPAEITARAMASKRGWRTRKRLKAARAAADQGEAA